MSSLWLSGYVEDKPLVTHVKTLNAARKAAIAANSSFLTTAVSITIYLSRSMYLTRSVFVGEVPVVGLGFHHGHPEAAHARTAFQRRKFIDTEMDRV